MPTFEFEGQKYEITLEEMSGLIVLPDGREMGIEWTETNPPTVEKIQVIGRVRTLDLDAGMAGGPRRVVARPCCAGCGATPHEDGEGADEEGEGGADGDVLLERVGTRVLCGKRAAAEARR